MKGLMLFTIAVFLAIVGVIVSKATIPMAAEPQITHSECMARAAANKHPAPQWACKQLEKE